jgi:hypothetical protein
MAMKRKPRVEGDGRGDARMGMHRYFHIEIIRISDENIIGIIELVVLEYPILK